MRSRFAFAMAAALLLATGWAHADTWATTDSNGDVVITQSDAQVPSVVVEYSDLTGLRVDVTTTGLTIKTHENKLGRFTEIGWPQAPTAGDIGAPALPVVRRLVAIPAGATADVFCHLGDAVVMDAKTFGQGFMLYPVQPPVEKIPGAIENAEFVIDKYAYDQDAFFCEQPAVLDELGSARGQRLAVLEIHPVSYNPTTGVVQYYPNMNVAVRFTGSSIPRDALRPLPGIRGTVLNPEVVPTVSMRGSGDYLIVTAEDFASDIAAFATAKAAQGYTVSTYTVPSGSSATAIRNYIISQVPDYVLLVGDTDTIPSFTGVGEGSPDTDLNYSMLDSGDYLPDLALGRFSARDATTLQAIIDKTLAYENGPLSDPDYLKRAVFMASEDNYDITEGTHNYVIDTWLEPNEYTCDKLYSHTYNATAEQVRTAFNDGRFYGIFSGHGASTYWADGPEFHEEDVEALTNMGMYSLICSFSCSTGDYAYLDECFMETWIRSAGNAACSAWGSSVSSYWTEDDILERVLFDAIFDDTDDVVSEIGPLYNESKVRFIAHFGDDSTTRRYFEMYNLMGDPALSLPGACSDAGTVQLDGAKYACEDQVLVRVVDCGLNLDDNVAETVEVAVDSESEVGVETALLTETTPNSATFEGVKFISTTDAPGVLLVAEGNKVAVTYIDADDGQGGTDVEVYATADVDCTPPTISNVQVLEVEPRDATIGFDTDEVAQGVVWYGLSCDALDNSAMGGFSATPTVAITGLQDNMTYFFMVEAVDEAGNVCTDPQCYMFTTPEVPDFFTELFETDFDLAGLSLMFVPGNPTDFYTGCVVGEITSLPTDPAGGTTVSLGDDASTEVSITGGNTVSLYGVSYSSFYICSNGYITFGTSDTTYSETLEDHFSLPRIAGIFDDFNPSSGGTVSYEQLADRMVVTWDGIPEYSESNSSTFQVEMYFDGTIVLSYLDVAVVDGLVGLSEGEGLDPDYFESDLSNMPSCGPRPPYAAGDEVLTDVNEPVDIELLASDDGLPDPPAALTYTIVSLPEHGDLSDPDGGVIDAVPYTLIAGNMVNYAPDYAYTGPDAFTFMVNDGGTPPDGGDSNVATISITVGGPQPVHVFMLDEDPDWSVEGEWAFGVPTGGGSHNYDPTSGYTGDNVYGYNLAGDYENEIPEYALTTTAIDCSDMTGVELRFWRWLGVESATWDHANVQVSNDGTTWTMVWEHTDSSISDTSWSQQVFDISGVADNAATVYVRWVMGETDTSVTYPGWNIDDIELWGVVPFEVATGDLNCDGYVNFDDINPFVTAMVGQAEYEAAYPDCNWLNGDTDANGTVNFDDIDGFVELLAGK